MELSSKYLKTAVENISLLPGIGKKTALRLALHLLNQPKERAEELAESILNMSSKIRHCQICNNLSDEQICFICSDKSRDFSTVCIVEDIRDVLAIEGTGLYKGVYHVLGGKISPMNGICASDLKINLLLERAEKKNIKEFIFALSPTIEGDTTAYYIYKLLPKKEDIKISCISKGVSIGSELQYIDDLTLARAIENRVLYENTISL